MEHWKTPVREESKVWMPPAVPVVPALHNLILLRQCGALTSHSSYMQPFMDPMDGTGDDY